jgi:hypothetical protein
MKTTIVGILLLIAGPAMAWEIEGNPDRKPSIGLEYTGVFLEGDGLYPAVSSIKRTGLQEDTNTIEADFRMPVNPSLTLYVGAGYVKKEIKGVDSDLFLFESEDEMTGGKIKLGARVYF